MSIRRYKSLYNATSAGTGSWIRLDARYEVDSLGRPLNISLTSGDTITLQALVKDWRPATGGVTEAAFLAAIVDADIATLKEYTESENDVLEGNWTYIRAIKGGTVGNATVEGFI